MTLGGYITLLASVAGLSAASAVQDPSFESPTYSPVFAPDAIQGVAPASQATATTTVQGERAATAQRSVSVTFTGASAREVIDWLTKQGVSFVVADSDLPTDRKVSMNIVNQPVESVVNALASALGGHWERRDGILVFRNGAGFGGFNLTTPTLIPGFEKATKEWKVAGPDGLMSAKDWEQFNKSLKDKYRGKIGTFSVPAQGFDYRPFLKMSEDQRKMSDQLRKQIETEVRAGDFKGLQKDALSKAELEKFQQQMKVFKDQQLKDAKTAEKMAKELQGKFYKSDQPFMDAKAAEKMAKELHEKFSKSQGFPKMELMPSIEFGGQDLTALMKSLSREQREKHKKQGFLRYSDLTPTQRRYLGSMGSRDNWTLKYKSGNDEVTIKSDRS